MNFARFLLETDRYRDGGTLILWAGIFGGLVALMTGAINPILGFIVGSVPTWLLVAWSFWYTERDGSR
jgi:hypothetical protein